VNINGYRKNEQPLPVYDRFTAVTLLPVCGERMEGMDTGRKNNNFRFESEKQISVFVAMNPTSVIITTSGL